MLKNLLGVYYKNSFSFKRLFGFDLKKNKGKTIMLGIALIYGVGAILGLFGWLFFDLGKTLDEMGQLSILLSFLGVLLITFPVFLTLFLASGSLFYYKDFDIVGHLPIKANTIFLAKLIVMISLLYAMTLLAVLPIIFSYFYWQGLDVLSLVLIIISGLVLPLVPIAIFSFLSLLIAMGTAKLKFGKLLYIVLLFVLLFGFMFLMFQFNEVEVNPLTGQIDLFKGIANAYPPLVWFREAVANHHWLNFLYLIGSHGVLFVGFIYVGARLAEYTNKRGIKSVTHHKKGPAKLQQADIVITLVKKEFKRLFSGINYALNTLFGVVIVIVLSIASLFFSDEILGFLSAELGGIIAPEMVIVVLIGFSIAMTTTPSVSLSLEGKKLWVIKSLPIKPYKLMYAKVLMNLVLMTPMIIIGTILFGVSSQIPLMNQLAMMLLFITFGIAISLLYAVINMLLPKFEFSNEVEVVKQSLSVLIAILLGFSLLALNGVGYWYVLADMNITLAFFILAVCNAIIAIPFWYVIRYRSEKIFSTYQG